MTKSGILYYRWRGSLGYVPETGKPNRVTLYARSEKDLRQKVAETLDNYRQGIKGTPKRMTVALWLQQWLDECCTDVKAKTRLSYDSIIKTHLIPGIGGLRLADLQPSHVQSFINGLEDVAPKTVKNIHGVLHMALQKAVEWSYIKRNPADRCALPRIEKQEVNFLAGDDLRSFLAACDGNEYAPMMKLAVFTGMRESEIIGLPWSAVDFEHHTITVKQQLQLIKGEYIIQTTKSDKARTLSPAPFVFDLLRSVRSEQSAMRLRMGTDWNGKNDLVFTRYDGRNIARNTLYKNFKRVLEAAGLPTTTRFHDLRHSYAVFSLECGDNIKQVQSALGHYSAAFTLNTYEHISEKAKEESAARQQVAIDNLLHG